MNRIPFLLFTLLLCFSGTLAQSNSEAKLISAPDVKIPDSVFKAGLGGSVSINISVDDLGNVEKAQIVGGPMWPCGVEPKDELKLLHQTIVDAMLATKFSPGTKGGKSTKSELSVTYSLKNPTETEAVSDNAPRAPKLINAGVINGRSERLVKPDYPAAARANRVSGLVNVEVLLDEAGKVEKAGVTSGHPLFHSSAREAACRSRFKPSILQGQRVGVKGVISYMFHP